MAYAIKYTAQFDSQSDANNASYRYTINFLFKDYSGPITRVQCGDSGAVQKCTIDEPNSAIKGQSLEISLLNINGSLPLTSFYSDSDNGIQVQLLDENNNILFIGFVVQDDCYEEMVDFTHQLSISANDSLGLLKGVILSEAQVRRGFTGSWVTDTDTTIIHIDAPNRAFYPDPGDTLEVAGVSYTVVTATYGQHTIGVHVYDWAIKVTPDTGGLAYTVGTFYLTYQMNLVNRNSILDIVAVCLYQTGIPVILNIFHNVFEYRMDLDISAFEQAILDTQMFINGETYDNCYDVLTKIMTTFRCTLFQANGQWNIVHWDEVRQYASNQIPGFIYDETFQFIGATIFNNNFNIGPAELTRPMYPLTGGIFRPYKFVRKEFDYTYPKYLLRNYDLLELGALISTYQQGGNTVSEYHAIGWEDNSGTPLYVNRFIRVIVENSSGAELSRELVLKGDTGVSSLSKSVTSKPIEVHVGDKIKFSFSVRGVNSFAGTWILQYAIMLTDGTFSKYVDDLPVGDGDWIPTIGFAYVGTGTNTNQWHSVEIISSPAPYSGLLYCYLTQMYSNGDETLYKDLRFEYIASISDSTKVIGQIHKQDRTVDIKNNSDVKIEIDDSPRNAIAGTIFLPTVTGLLQDRTAIWTYKTDITTGYKLGELMCKEELQWRDMLRSKLDGSFVGIKQQQMISLLACGITTFTPTKNYIFGLLNIDYKQNRITATLFEQFDSAETAVVNTYSFTYIYSTT